MSPRTLLAGVDVGSTTVKIALIDPISRELIYSKYRRHNAEQARSVVTLLEEAHEAYPDAEFRMAFCGSGGHPLAKILDAFFVQEVIANSLAIRAFHQDVRVAIELGGQDAKVIFFRKEESSGQLMVTDMRMNGSCAGGTGAFIDQVAELLHVAVEDMGELANSGKNVYDISGRCGVFAKTDIQPLLNQGVSKEDIALSSFHAIAKQTIGGLAQGMEFTPKVIFEGGPLHFNPRLIEVFKERLHLKDEDVVIPQKPEIMVAWGAALATEIIFEGKESLYKGKASIRNFQKHIDSGLKDLSSTTVKFFENDKEKKDFQERHKLYILEPKTYERGTILDVYLGLDAGSTTSKFVLMNESEEIVDIFYANNQGDPLKIIREGMITMRDKYKAMGVRLNILGVGSTGYGENLFAKAFKTDYHTVETVSHARAARKYAPDVSFILDIGGQDMKAINLRDSIVTGIVLNEACSAGCGSFVETYARSLGVEVQNIAPLAFEAEHPSRLGSRCTVFMNSSIITEQKNGKTTSDILAGICRSIIENVFTKVVRISNLNTLGDKIVVQGGTFKNDAVLRAFEQYTEKLVVRPPFPGEMGAIGIALLTKEFMEHEGKTSSNFIGLDALDQFTYEKKPGVVCTFCTNNCSRTVVTFNDGTNYVTGNRCERGEIIGEINDPSVKEQLKEANVKMESVPDMMKFQNDLLYKIPEVRMIAGPQNIRIGIPMVLEFWHSLPYWHAIFKSLGFTVVLPRKSTYEMFNSGLSSIPSDTVCFPAKLAHGHVQSLIKAKVDRIFFPMMIRIPKLNKNADSSHVCSVVQGYPLVVEKSDEPYEKHNVIMDKPTFHWYNEKLKIHQTIDYLCHTFGFARSKAAAAVREGNKALKNYRKTVLNAGREVLHSLKKPEDFAVILAGRPYHADMLVNHNLSSHFTKLGIPVLTLDSLPNFHSQNLNAVRMETTIPFHAQMAEAALYAAKHDNIELVEIVSFGCGHDAIISDEMTRLLHEFSDKEMLILKLDEGEAVGPLNIRIKSFIETIVGRRQSLPRKGLNINIAQKFDEIREAFPIKFTKPDRKKRTIYLPNLSPSFTVIAEHAMASLGYITKALPMADREAIALGKKYVHNDICYPAQINVGEFLRMLDDPSIDKDTIAFGLAKNCEDCRAGQYASLARKALDEAGYPNVPIITTGIDNKRLHPGFKIGLKWQIDMLWGLSILDSMESIRRRIRPYEENKGQCDHAFNESLQRIARIMPYSKRKATALFEEFIDICNAIPLREIPRKPRVFIIGEILLNYHPSSNGYIERYLENNGMETVFPGMVDFFRRTILMEKLKSKRRMLPMPALNFFIQDITDRVYNAVIKRIQKSYQKFKFCEGFLSVYDLAENVKDLIDLSYCVGEGWLIPAEIIAQAKHGVNSFAILQPFGCLPNHITGRGMTKSMKKMFPHIQIVSLDYDPDTSFANVENRLQMLIIGAKEMEKTRVS